MAKSDSPELARKWWRSTQVPNLVSPRGFLRMRTVWGALAWLALIMCLTGFQALSVGNGRLTGTRSRLWTMTSPPSAVPTAKQSGFKADSAGDSKVIKESWSLSSWQSRPAQQAPTYLDEVRKLQEQLALASVGQAFLLTGGDCAESFNEFSVNHIRDTLRVMLQMALVMTFGGSIPVIKVGRMAGQFAKPRSEDIETRGSIALPSYRGDIINGEAFTPEARSHDPQRMLDAYHQAAQTLNILRAFTVGGYADITRLHAWNLDFVEHLPAGSKYRHMCDKVDECLAFIRALGVDTRAPAFTQTSFYTAHEALLLPYEQALTRQDSITGGWYDCSAHLLWVGERTRQVDHAHLHFLSGVGNPVGVKVSEHCTPSELIETLDVLNPLNTPGRVTVITRMGEENLRRQLPSLIRAVQREGRSVVWCCDPLHANTVKTAEGFKTRPFARILAEVGAFFDVHAEMGSHPGGVHLEMTGQDVTECLGGGVDEVLLTDMNRAYTTSCDPRLNGNQAIELFFLLAERMRAAQGLLPPFSAAP